MSDDPSLNSSVPNPGPSMQSKVLKTGAWTLVGFGASQVLRLVGNLIMTRLLVPENFGVLALANVILFGLYMFSDLGLKQNIIQSARGDDEDYLNTVWTIQILRGLLLWVVTVITALAIVVMVNLGWLGANSSYSDPELPWIIGVISISAIIGGFESTKPATASRHMNYARQTLMGLVIQSITFAAMIILGLLTHSVWALVVSSLLGTFLQTIYTHIGFPGKANRLLWRPDVVREVVRFGKWVFVSSIIGFLASNGDRLTLGGLISPTDLGLYATAYLMLMVMLDLFNRVAYTTSLPALSQTVRDDPTSLRRNYYRFRAIFDSVSLTLAGIMMVAGHLVIDILYDQRYAGAGIFLQLLSVALLESRFAVLQNAYLAVGKPKYQIPGSLIRTAVLFGGLPVVYHLAGLNAAVLLIGLSSLVTIPLSLWFAARLKLLDWKKELLFLPLFPAGLLLGWGIDIAGRWLLPFIALHPGK